MAAPGRLKTPTIAAAVESRYLISAGHRYGHEQRQRADDQGDQRGPAAG
jgi:hypothetical protein